MTDHLGWHQKRFGDGKSTVHFLKGYIERLDELDLAAERLGEVIRIAQEVRAFGAVLPN